MRLSLRAGDPYRCAECGGTYIATRGEGETRAEYDELFPDDKHEPREVLCHFCWQMLMLYLRIEGKLETEHRGAPEVTPAAEKAKADE